MIVDGMGFEYIKAARIYNGLKPLRYENFSCSTKVSTCAYDGADAQGHCLADSDHVTDSAAAATAIATGYKVHNGVVSKLNDQKEYDIETILEISKRQGKSTGVVATKLFTDATPAAFVAHAVGRNMTEEILTDIFQGSKPNLVFGADTSQHRAVAKASSTNYAFVHSASALKTLTASIDEGQSCAGSECPYVYGGFGEHELIPGQYRKITGLPLEITPQETFKVLDIPHLSEMTEAALTILNKNSQGFFLMVESSLPDTIGHYNAQIDAEKSAPSAIEALISEMREVENTVKVLEQFVAKNPETLVILTADHETGGLRIEEDKTACLGEEKCVPKVLWTSAKYEPTPDSPARHTKVDVPLFALGAGAEHFCQERINNIEIKNLALGTKQ